MLLQFLVGACANGTCRLPISPHPPVFHISTLCVSPREEFQGQVTGSALTSAGENCSGQNREERASQVLEVPLLVPFPGLPAWSDGPARVVVSSLAIVYMLRSLQLRGTVVISSVHVESRSWQDTFSEM